jgi:hypothetical protein
LVFAALHLGVLVEDSLELLVEAVVGIELFHNFALRCGNVRSWR